MPSIRLGELEQQMERSLLRTKSRKTVVIYKHEYDTYDWENITAFGSG